MFPYPLPFIISVIASCNFSKVSTENHGNIHQEICAVIHPKEETKAIIHPMIYSKREKKINGKTSDYLHI